MLQTLLLLFACNGTNNKIPDGAIGDRLVITRGLYQEVPLTWDGITEAGFIGAMDCSDRMGRHAVWEVNGLAVTEFVFNNTGHLIGIEVVSEADEPVPPWDTFGQGEPEGENSKIHTYFSNHETACDANSPEPVGLGDQVTMSWGYFTEMPLTIDAALEQGWIDTGTCVENEGIYVYKDEVVNDAPWPIRMMFNPAGTLIGLEISSWSEQVINPWSAPENEGDPWTYSMWFTDPASACQE